MTIRVLLADDQALLRGAFRMLIDAEEDMEVVGEAADGREAVELARATKPDIVLMDIRMPGADGLGATAEICADEELSGTRVLILTTFEIDEYVAQALRAGAGGFLGKGADPKELLAAVRTVAAGDALLSPAATRAVIEQFLAQPDPAAVAPSERLSVLTAREREVMSMAATGLTNEEIAERMFVSPFTVRTHVHRAMAKLDARDRAQLVAIAYQSGLVPPGRPS
ncbi:response regulator [Kitasatospora aureofaciens]|uniref:DNA-binding response regulator n=1 Tax=Kitasatospora aureofaciens TaxID=1894 RepID=A0A1E7N801_KITAU|nr:response regulator transcription factor [Kitasatospora aureofaciens]ARF82406.1 DNA-binding response regulator [Kitasatospora aureofaciens]OEV36811.1 DNA-binding response regulator [Kitasatospora aureofaciens]GGU70321.1 DNA-binding response regulator [Kitasatospora aureofaciens]HJD82779.1 response regulator transcription factor [Kitasatospora aureofaciens]